MAARQQSKAPAAFLSYAHLDDEASGGLISRLRERLALAVSVAVGEKFEIFQDHDGIAWGQHWAHRLDEALEQALFLIPILTPAYFKSRPCREELEKFLELERRTGREDLILPIYFYTARAFEQRSDRLAATLSRRQYRDWRELRQRPIDSPEVRQALEQLADEIEAAVHRPAPAGEAGKRAPPPEDIAEGPPVHPPAAEPPPDLEPIEEERRVVRNVALRAKPSLAAAIVTRLKAGAVVYVAGRARDSGWLRIEGEGDLRGYVVADAVEPLEPPTPKPPGNGESQRLDSPADDIEAVSRRPTEDETGGSALSPAKGAGGAPEHASTVEQPPDEGSIERENRTVRDAASRAGGLSEPDVALRHREVPDPRDRSGSIGDTAAANGGALREGQKDHGREPASGVEAVSAVVGRPAPHEPGKSPPRTRGRLLFIVALLLSLGLAGLIVAVQLEWPSGRTSQTEREGSQGDLPPAAEPPRAGDATVTEAVGRSGSEVIELSGDYPEPFSVFRDCAECPEMVALAGGTFRMGSPGGEEGRDDDEGPRHEVTVAPFALGRYEVTFEEWDACVAAGGCNYEPDDEGWRQGRRPVINVSWNDAHEYVAWLSRETGATYRLPSEAEWEYAARAGTTTRYWWGDAITPEDANYGSNVGQTTEVGSYPANPWGLHDTAGNVWEWVEDRWHENYEGAPRDGSAWLDGTNSARVVRGGSWYIEPRFLRAASRGRLEPGYRFNYAGFRVARMLTP